MQNTECLIGLRNLSDELSAINDGLGLGEQVVDETIEELGQLVTELSDLIDQCNESSGIPPAVDDLLDRVGQFECDVPRVAEFLNNLTELLEMMNL